MRYTHIFTLANGETSCSLIFTELKNADLVKNNQQVAIKDFGDAKNTNSVACLKVRTEDGITRPSSNL